LAALPRVRQVSFAKFCQGDERFIVSFNYELTTATETNSFVWGNVVGLGYFRALGTPIVRGRDFTPSDVNTRAVVIVNQRMADQLWPGQEPLGQRMKVTVNSTTKSDPVWAEVIGVAKDGQYFSLFQNGRGPFLSVLCYLLFNASGL